MYDHLNKTKILTSMIAIAILIFSFLGFNNVSAIDDWTTSVGYSTTFPFYICGDSSGRSCSDYNYLIIEYDTLVGANQATRLYFDNTGNYSRSVDILPFTDFYTIKIPSNYASNGSISILNTNGYPGTINLTLTDSLPGECSVSGSLNITENGTFDVSEVASVNVNVPQNVTEIIDDPVSNDFHKIFMVVVAGVIPAFAVFVIVWFAIDLMSSLFFGRGR